LSVPLGTLNTVILLTSSFTVAMALHSIQLGKSKACFNYLAITIFFACCFLVVKFIEYRFDYLEHLVPFFKSYDFEKPETLATFPEYFVGGTRIFFMLYFLMTVVHAIHIIVGIIIIACVASRTRQGRYNNVVHTGVELAAIYWHFVDVVWIFLFPILYLMDSHVHI
jgi:cytochrome c oxidase subunit 3